MQGETLVYNNSDLPNCGPNNIVDRVSYTNSENKIQSIHNINSLPDLPIQSLFRSISVKQDCSILKAAFAHARRSILCTESSQYIESVYKLIIQNLCHDDFYLAIKSCLEEEAHFINEMLYSSQLTQVLKAMELIVAALKQDAYFMFHKRDILYCLGLCQQYPSANVLHSLVLNMFGLIFGTPSPQNEKIINYMLLNSLFPTLIDGLVMKEKIGFRSHYKLISIAIRDSKSAILKKTLHFDKAWLRYLTIMDIENENSRNFNGLTWITTSVSNLFSYITSSYLFSSHEKSNIEETIQTNPCRITIREKNLIVTLELEALLSTLTKKETPSTQESMNIPLSIPQSTCASSCSPSEHSSSYIIFS